jgi:hypothetical protein
MEVDDVRQLLPTLPAVANETFTFTHYVDIDLEDFVYTMLEFYYDGTSA